MRLEAGKKGGRKTAPFLSALTVGSVSRRIACPSLEQRGQNEMRPQQLPPLLRMPLQEFHNDIQRLLVGVILGWAQGE